MNPCIHTRDVTEYVYTVWNEQKLCPKQMQTQTLFLLEGLAEEFTRHLVQTRDDQT